jgi:hypothetical protein
MREEDISSIDGNSSLARATVDFELFHVCIGSCVNLDFTPSPKVNRGSSNRGMALLASSAVSLDIKLIFTNDLQELYFASTTTLESLQFYVNMRIKSRLVNILPFQIWTTQFWICSSV